MEMENLIEKSFKCEICNSHFARKSSLKRHISSVHEAYKPFKCEVCDFSSSQKNTLNTHVASVHEEKKPFKCDICDYIQIFKKKWLEDTHRNSS